jgi:hypothetical protein
VQGPHLVLKGPLSLSQSSETSIIDTIQVGRKQKIPVGNECFTGMIMVNSAFAEKEEKDFSTWIRCLCEVQLSQKMSMGPRQGWEAEAQPHTDRGGHWRKGV